MSHPAETICTALRSSFDEERGKQLDHFDKALFEFHPTYEAAASVALRFGKAIIVTPRSQDGGGLFNRVTTDERTGVDVSYVAKLTNPDVRKEWKSDELNARLANVYQLQTYILKTKKFGGYLVEPEFDNDPIYDRKLLESKRVFLSVTTFTFETRRDLS